MTTQKIGDNVIIACEVWSRGNSAWGHRAVCLYNGREVAEVKCRYLNRTWEAYQFDSVKSSLLYKLDQEKIIPLADRYLIAKALHN
jgi:hypothetical protein